MSYLTSLNPAQLAAVNHQPNVPLQILAGPGSGKTKVLTSRIAHLILHHKLSPAAICAVTFTNKAANEMKGRLAKLIGKEKMIQVRMGTFHALCALFLRKYATVVGLADNFAICDADESKKIINTLLKGYKEALEAKEITLKDHTVQSIISKAKAKSLSAKQFSEEVQGRIRGNASGFRSISDEIDLVVAEIYEEYEKHLRRNNSLDFDDLLVYGLKLFTQHKQAVRWCKHVLVDEFQDTNITQYELMRAIAIAHCVTIVGDPDQSIYGWRSAEVGNLAKMRKDFKGTQHIFLEQNYRSTSSILKASIAIVEQDRSRIKKTLHASHPSGTTPVLLQFLDEQAEAAGIAAEIKRLIAHTGGLLGFGDFVVLLRFNALSRAIESALQKEGIPNRVLKGHRFFERLEVKDLLAYLQLVDNPQFVPAFTRIVNVPARGVGEKTLQELLSTAEKQKVSPLEIVENIIDGKTPDIKPPVKRKLGSFVSAIRSIRKLTLEGASPAVLIRKLYEVIGYEDHLKKTQPDWESRWENVQELITFASDVDTDIKSRYDSGEEDTDTPLRLFLQASMLSSEGDNENSDEDKNKVTISTCHAAKGLEWPVVIIPAVEDGAFPFYRSEDKEEERRLLYVACTRAQSLLYIYYASTRKVGGVAKPRDLSTFISAVTLKNDTLFTDQLPAITAQERAIIAGVLDRPDVPDELVQIAVDDYVSKTARRQEKAPLSAWDMSSDDDILDVQLNSSSALLVSSSQMSTGPAAFSSGRNVLSALCAGASDSSDYIRAAMKPKVGGFSRPVGGSTLAQQRVSDSTQVVERVKARTEARWEMSSHSSPTSKIELNASGSMKPTSAINIQQSGISRSAGVVGRWNLPTEPRSQSMSSDSHSSTPSTPEVKLKASGPMQVYSKAPRSQLPHNHTPNNQNMTPHMPYYPAAHSHDYAKKANPMPYPTVPAHQTGSASAPLQMASNRLIPAQRRTAVPDNKSPISHSQASSTPPTNTFASSTQLPRNLVPSGPPIPLPTHTPTARAVSVTPSSQSGGDAAPTIGAKRRLGMGRVTGGYTNKKFKPPG
ncbi:atp-depentend dna [Moniliophthora roreri MCA 2997]|uniref:DNA 3'-5' helicase n=1 Tax=Moniliophthora roreri (strain MCA 2997) TaxID=1381753 RepID=V2X6B3_MONRO|nr:atp-depentend dna [Moniliophthora roreri MCA 2997]